MEALSDETPRGANTVGLDVYLRKYDDFADTQKREKAYEKRTEPLYADGNGLTDEQRKAKREAIAAELQLDEWGTDKALVHEVSSNSAKYPEHYFKIGYFRSSYND